MLLTTLAIEPAAALVTTIPLPGGGPCRSGSV
jgi:hypothetical protein